MFIRDKQTREASIESYLVKEVVAAKGLAKKVQKLRGWPDRLILWPDGIADFIELKRPVGGRFEPLQERVHRMLASKGFEIRVINTKEMVDEYVRFRCPSYKRKPTVPLKRAREL